jgi:hypothetical protein
MKTTYFKFRCLAGVESDMGVINNLGLVEIIEFRQDIPLLLVF